jgi:RHS repeat-associated protein
MKSQRVKRNNAALIASLGIATLTVTALAIPPYEAPERVQSERHTYLLPTSAEVSRTLLPDGRTFEVHGAEGFAYLISADARKKIMLPEARRFASVTVLPGGEVLIWGGIDARGHVLGNGEWFEPIRDAFAPTGMLSLPARAGHSMTLLTDGRLMMVGGWTNTGELATDIAFWVPLTSRLTTMPNAENLPRLLPKATLQSDGAVQITEGVDAYGNTLTSKFVYRENTGGDATAGASEVASSPVHTTLMSDNIANVPLRGKLVLRLPALADVRSVNTKTVTLLGPEGQVSARVVAAEAGRLIFVQPHEELYPTSRYTLFAKGVTTTSGTLLPFKAIGFTTGQANVPGMAMTPDLPQAAKGNANAKALPPLYVMAGGGHAYCDGGKPMPLCRKHGKVEDGAWFPGDDNVADATGGHWRVYHAHQSLPDTRALQAALPGGITAIIGQVRQIDEKPVANVEISVGEQKARTDAQGVFVLKDLPAGHQVLFVDGGSADHGSVQYGRFLVGAEVHAKRVQRMPFVMYLPRILARDDVTLPSSNDREVVITHPDLPGLELHVPAGAVFKDRNGKILTHIAIVPTPVDHAPFPLPDNFPTYFTIQPSDAVVQGLTVEASKGIRVVYPNYGHAAPNTTSAFWAYDPQLGWRIYGDGHITADAQHIEPDNGVAFVWMAGASAALSPAAPPNNSLACQTAKKGQPVDLESGLFFHEWSDLSVNDIVPLTLERAYNSQDSVSHMFGIGGNSNLGIHLFSNNGFLTPQLVLPCGQGLSFNEVSGGNPQSTDAVGVVWEYTGSDSAFYGATLQFTDSDGDGEYWQINLKDGTQYRFQNGYNSQLEWIQDRFGNALQFTYNGGLIEQATSPSGRYIIFNYDTSNRVTSAIDNSGRKVSYAYNSAGTLATVTYPDQTTEKYTYDGSNRMLTMQDRRGNVWVTNQYDANGRVIKQTYTDNTYYQFGYTTNSSNVVTATIVTDPNGNQEQITFDPVSRLPATDTYAYGNSLAQTITYSRAPTGLINSMTDALGRTTTYAYDYMGNVTNVTELSGTSSAITTQFTYTSDYNQLASVTDPLGNVTQFGYTSGCLSSETDALGHSTVIRCNAAGQPIGVQDALGHAALIAYQGYDLQSVTDALARTTSFTVDALGRPISTRDPLGNVALTQYDTNNRVTSVTDALNQTTSVSYDGNGNLLTVTLPNQGVITSTYDARNRRITRADAMNQSESWTYDGMNNVTSHTDRKAQLTQISYDALNRPGLMSYADGSGIQATYDAGNRLTQLADSVSGTYGWGYDGLDHVLSTTGSQGSVSYTYDADGRRITMTPAAQATATYTYDNANRLTGITQGSETVQLAYDAANRRTTLTLPNGVAVNYGYDNANELLGLAYVQANGTVLGNLAYGYDNGGRRVSKTNSFNTDLLPAPTTQTPTFDLNDRETSFNGQALTYDADGNLTFDGTNTYTWNARNQLTQVSQNGVAQLSYTYDALGRRTSKAVQGGTPTQYLYDRFNAVQETQGGTINPILNGLGIDERFARNDATGRTYFLADALGSTIALTSSNGAIQNTYSYDPYGNTTQSATGFTNPYQYTGREADAAGLYYYRARYYSPGMGSFVSEDPIGFGGGQLSFYAYAGGNPIMYRDPRGHELVLALVGTAIGGAFGYINGRLSGDTGDQLLEDIGTGAAIGFVGGLSNGLSFAAGFAGTATWGEVAGGVVLRALFAADMEGMRQANNYGCVTSFRDVGLSGLFSVAGDFIGDYFGAGKQFEGMSEQAAGRAGTVFGGAASGAAGSAVAASEGDDGSGY